MGEQICRNGEKTEERLLRFHYVPRKSGKHWTLGEQTHVGLKNIRDLVVFLPCALYKYVYIYMET